MNVPTTLRTVFLIGLSAVAGTAAGSVSSQTFPAYPGLIDGHAAVVTASMTHSRDANRRYALASTASQREGAPQQRTIQEETGQLRVRSASVLFDALFAEAIDDLRLDSVSVIRDDAYNGGQPIRCDCFQTGEKWRYVWTRDLSYSSDLALGFLDPARTVNSLQFKTSGFREAVAPPAGLPDGSWQIVQDTGSGGSWPVSSDRVVWAMGAEAVLANLGGEARHEFSATAWQSLRGTLEADRLAVFDPQDGLYAGEQSFLDWREQTYAPYVVDDLTQIARSKALSTNVLHYRALRFGARLALEHGDPAAAARYGEWAEHLRTAINARFWMPEHGLYASITTADDTAAPVERFDLLGEALAILAGVADGDRAREIMARYPHAPFGAPVYFPEQPGIPVYHNRSIWPFVTAYALQAAAMVGNTAAADNAFDSLVRSAGLHLTNTENLEWLTGQSAFDDGPVINSPRQIWSVAGYLSMVAHTLFGYSVTDEGVAVRPFLTAHMRDALGGRQATLLGLQYQGRQIDIRLVLPPHAASGAYATRRILLNGRPAPTVITAGQLLPQNRIDVYFGRASDRESPLTSVPVVSPASHDDPRVFAPVVPGVAATVAQGHTVLTVTHAGAAADRVLLDVARDGVTLERRIEAREWRDPDVLEPTVRHCYRVTARYAGSDLASHPSRAVCVGESASRTQPLPAVTSSPGVIPFSVSAGGRYELTLTYDNHAYALNTGVTNAVQRAWVMDRAGRSVASAVIQMPHTHPVDGLHPWNPSTALRADLPAGEYTLKLEDFFNMSYLQANATYAHPGGERGPQNAADVRALTVTRIPDASRRCGRDVAAGIRCD